MRRHPLGRYPDLHVPRSQRAAPGSWLAWAVIAGAVIWTALAAIALTVWP